MNPADELNLLKQLLVDADATATELNIPYGLCDAIDNRGDPYQSMTLAQVLGRCRDEGIRPARTLEEIAAGEAWRKALPMTEGLVRTLEARLKLGGSQHG